MNRNSLLAISLSGLIVLSFQNCGQPKGKSEKTVDASEEAVQRFFESVNEHNNNSEEGTYNTKLCEEIASGKYDSEYDKETLDQIKRILGCNEENYNRGEVPPMDPNPPSDGEQPPVDEGKDKDKQLYTHLHGDKYSLPGNGTDIGKMDCEKKNVSTVHSGHIHTRCKIKDTSSNFLMCFFGLSNTGIYMDESIKSVGTCFFRNGRAAAHEKTIEVFKYIAKSSNFSDKYFKNQKFTCKTRNNHLVAGMGRLSTTTCNMESWQETSLPTPPNITYSDFSEASFCKRGGDAYRYKFNSLRGPVDVVQKSCEFLYPDLGLTSCSMQKLISSAWPYKLQTTCRISASAQQTDELKASAIAVLNKILGSDEHTSCKYLGNRYLRCKRK